MKVFNYKDDKKVKDIITMFLPGFKELNINLIYSGLDHHCRCGCGGTYYYIDKTPSPVIRRILTRALKFFKMNESECEMCIHLDNDGDWWLNIPTSFTTHYGEGRCYCIYFQPSDEFRQAFASSFKEN